MLKQVQQDGILGRSCPQKERAGVSPGPSLNRCGADQAPTTSVVSTFTPGPIDDDSAIFLTYLPFAPDGLALTMASTKASKFWRSFSSPNDSLPRPAWMMQAFSPRNSIWNSEEHTSEHQSQMSIPY